VDNWAGNYRYRARRVHRPTSIDELTSLVARLPRVRILGSRHSFTDLADADELISLESLPADITIDDSTGSVSFGAALRYGELATHLDSHGLALANLASLPHVTVAGAVATATHGSGLRLGNLATSVAALEIVNSAGEVVARHRGQPDFDGMVVGLGAFGAVTRLTLDVEPSFQVSQRVYERLKWHTFLEHFEEIEAAGYSVSVFTNWGSEVDQIWVKRRADGSGPESEELFGAKPATGQRHPIRGMDASSCTPQLGLVGPWFDRLPHFAMAHVPSAGREVQSEYLVPRRHASDAIHAVRQLASRIRPLLQVSELRLVAADRLWMSPQYGTDTLGIHFTWLPDEPAVRKVLPDLEAALEPFDARPHWGKVFAMDSTRLVPAYERHGDFMALVERTDARGAFRNSWFERTLGRRAA
jgi:xylitol oxidase